MFDELERHLQDCLLRERTALARRLQGLRRRAERGQPIDRGLSELGAAIEAAAARGRARRAALPRPSFDDSLPINQKRAEIAAAIREHQVVVVCGETGSGKTTQLPKICLELGLGAAGLIGHTQPRRIAARSVAARIAEELGVSVGSAVGYKVRFNERVGEDTLIKLMTDGILLAETQGDRELTQYEVLIIDEAHERSLNIDFLLGYLKQLLPRRPDLKIIVTSATIDPERFARHFNGAPILEVSGRTYPVEVRYRPLAAEDEDVRDRDLQQAILEAVDEVWGEGPGDILIFLCGEREIRETAESLRKHHPPGVEILPLYARLSAAEQMRVFQPHGRPRIVLATNVAETSLTVPGIRYVIDPGMARISRYSHRAKIQRLPIEPVSQASAAQRAGRCGRVMAGVCIRLYSEEDFRSRPAFTDPEILRTNLAAVILQMAALDLGEVEDFPFIDAPDRRLVSDGYKLLHELGAVDAGNRITRLGCKLAKLPIDPRLGRMILAAESDGCLREVLIITAALAIQDPRERPLEHQQQADQKHRRFNDPRSDFLGWLRLWDWFHEQARHLSRNKLRELCKSAFLSYVRMREWHELCQQLTNLVAELGMKLNEREPAPPLDATDEELARGWPRNYAALHRALLTGLLGQIGLRQEDGYLGARSRRFHLFPGSGLYRKQPKWLVAAELVETSRVYARNAARIEPEWIEPLAGHLVKRSYAEPHWEKRPAQVAALETVTLYGLPIVSGRKVNYGPIDPKRARELFIRHALVEGEFHCNAPFFRHNRGLLVEVEELESKTRRRDLQLDPEELYRFYDERIPEGIYSGAAFEQWRKRIERDDPRLLFFDEQQWLARRQTVSAADYPDHLQVSGLELPLSYTFEPGRTDDGVTLAVPLAALNLLRPERLEWLVPGLLAEKITALLKSLPKALRKHFVPVPDYVERLLPRLEPAAEEGLLTALSRELKAVSGVDIPADAWNPAALPLHLMLNIRVLDADGKVLAEGRDLEALQLQLRQQARSAFAELARAPARRESGRQKTATQPVPAPAAATHPWERRDLHDWDFGTLPEEVAFTRNNIALKGYPALTLEADATLALKLFDTPERARVEHRRGLWRLIELRHRDKVKYLRRNLPGLQTMALHFIRVGRQEQLVDDLVHAILDRAYLEGELPRDRRAFEACLERGGPRLLEMANQVCAIVGAILEQYHQVNKRLAGTVALSALEAVQDVREQLAELIYPGFVAATPDPWLGHLPRYLKAAALRLDKLMREPERDRQRRGEIERLWRQYRLRKAEHQKREWLDPELDLYHWWLEELRVSLFAQELRTAFPVSMKRLEEQWAKVR
ncbi:MAG TPA: ATP-dependent RNA helicase HrpA [Candidatus Competibacteraceae bacterium]|nr:ATP-dependent RNA helicase HrpA [Candidatus Competibacteraceae bacterium]